MSFDQNTEIIEKLKHKKLYLFDTGVFSRSEDIEQESGVDFISVFDALPDEHFLIGNEVFNELLKGKRSINFGFFNGHILHPEGGMAAKWKENRFLIEEEGETRFIVLNKISGVDYMQVLMCQNHPELTLVSNDRKLLKSAVHVIGGRVLGFPILIDRLHTKYPQNMQLLQLHQKIDEMYELKSALDRNRTIKRVQN